MNGCVHSGWDACVHSGIGGAQVSRVITPQSLLGLSSLCNHHIEQGPDFLCMLVTPLLSQLEICASFQDHPLFFSPERTHPPSGHNFFYFPLSWSSPYTGHTLLTPWNEENVRVVTRSSQCGFKKIYFPYSCRKDFASFSFFFGFCGHCAMATRNSIFFYVY